MMDADDLIMVSVDDHLVEPPNLFEGRLPAKFQDEAPRVKRLPDGSDVWVFNGQTIPNIGLNAVAGRPREEYGIEPTAFEEMRPGCFDVHERIKDMNAGGVLGSMNFPSFPGFSARFFAACPDKELVQRLAHRRVVRFIPRPIHPDGTAHPLGSRTLRGRDTASCSERLSLVDLYREPRRPQVPKLS
jgi:hypothetical protein